MSTNTIRVPFPTRLTSLATNTTLGTATRHDFAATTVPMPETTRTIRSVLLQVSARDQFGSAIDFDGIRVGIKINAVAFDDVDYTIATANTGDHQTLHWQRDVTAYFVTNDPGTATFTAEVGVAFATSSASNVTGVTAVLIITYEHDDSTDQRAKTIGYLIQSHHTTLTTSYIEIGTTGGVSNAPANQIRQLTGSGSPMLPEDDIAIVHYYADVTAIDNGTGADITPSYRVDGSTDNARFVCTQTLSSNVGFFDRFDLTGLSTTAAHAFEAKADVTGKMEHIGVIVWVTYTYDASTTTRALQSLLLPLSNGTSTVYTLHDTTSTDAERWQVELDIQEPGTITMDQSGVVLFLNSNNISRSVLASGQTARVYSSASNLIRDTAEPLIHRGDHSSSTWTLARGKNRLTVDLYSSTEGSATLYSRGGYALINYTSDVSPNGIGAHAHTTAWNITTSMVTSAARNTSTPNPVDVPEAQWGLLGSYVHTQFHGTSGSQHLGVERAAGEGQGGGWQYAIVPNVSTVDAEVGSKNFFTPTSHWWRRAYGMAFEDPERMDITTSRDWTVFMFNLAVNWLSCAHYVTYHANTFTVAGVVEVDGAPVADGKTVEVWALDGDNGAELVGTDTTSGGTGAFSIEVLDDTRTYKATYEDGAVVGASLYGTPDDDNFDVTIFTGAGGGGYSRSRVVNACG